MASTLSIFTGMPGGTVYPALRRLEEAGYLRSAWEEAAIAQNANPDAQEADMLLRLRRRAQ